MSAGSGWVHLTALGDSAVLLPVAVLLAVWLLIQRASRRHGLWWLLLLAGCIGGVAVSKLAYMGWGLHPPGLDFVGLSGHCALSFLIWPTVAALLAARARPLWRGSAVALGALLALGISVSRLAVDAHTPSEAALGALWGALFGALFLWITRHSPRLRGRAGWAAFGLLLPVLLMYGRVLPSNRILAGVARTISGHARIYTRCDLPRALRGDACAPAPRPRRAPARGSRIPNARH